MTIASIIQGRDQSIVSCHPDQSVGEAARLLADRRIGTLPVMADGAVVGIFSERDVLYSVASAGGSALERTVGEVMTSPAISISPSEKALDALALMTRRRIRHLPVIDGDTLVGFVSIGDLVKYRIERIEAEASQMRDYIRMA